MVANRLFQNPLHSFSDEIGEVAVDNKVRNSGLKLTRCGTASTITRRRSSMAKHNHSPDQGVITFPGPSALDSDQRLDSRHQADARKTEIACEVVLSGSYRKAFEVLKGTYEQFHDLGCTVLSPTSISIVREEDGFVYMEG